MDLWFWKETEKKVGMLKEIKGFVYFVIGGIILIEVLSLAREVVE